MSDRPVYVGAGDCTCGRTDVLLYHLPGKLNTFSPVCKVCADKAGCPVGKVRTAEDLINVNGELRWKDET